MNIEEKLQYYNEMYRIGTPVVSDEEYDTLIEQLPEDHKLRLKPEEEVIFKNRIKHSKPLLSMQKAKKDSEIEAWFNKIEESAKRLNVPLNEVIILMNQKLDGIACVRENGKFATRGNGLLGNDITNLLQKGVHLQISDSDRNLGELVVKLDYFNENLKDDFSNARNFVSGAVMADTLNAKTERAFNDKAIIFQEYTRLPFISNTLLSIRKNYRESEQELHNSLVYLIDGVILTVTNKEIQQEMGYTSHHPNYAIALKPNNKEYEAIVKDIIWQTGRTGRVIPTVIIEPVDIDGVTIQRCTGHNAKYIQDSGITISCSINIIRSGDVIPYIVGVNNG